MTLLLQVSEAEENESEPLPLGSKPEVAVAARHILTKDRDYPKVPKEFSSWMVNAKGLMKPTVKVYSHDISQFLGRIFFYFDL